MRVRAVRDCFVGHHWKQGEEGEYSGPKNTNLEPVKAAKPEPAKPEPVKVEPAKPEPEEENAEK